MLIGQGAHPSHDRGLSRVAAAVTMLQTEHVQLVSSGYRLRTSQLRVIPHEPGMVNVKLTWCRRRNGSQVVKRSARLTDVAHLLLMGWIMGVTPG